MDDPAPEPVIDTFPLGPFATNCYVVSVPGDDACWIIDASFEPRPLIDWVRDKGLRPAAIILTHAHVDHIAGLDEVRAAFPDAEVLIHKMESAHLGAPELNLSLAHGTPVACAPADRTLAGGETLDLAGASFEALFTPGHSPGGLTLYSAAAGAAIVGDTLFAGSVGRSDFPTSDPDDLAASIRETLYALPDDTRVFPGHGPATTIGREKATNPFVRP